MSGNSFGSNNNSMGIGSLMGNSGNQNGNMFGGNGNANMDIDGKTSTQVTIPKDVRNIAFFFFLLNLIISFIQLVGWRNHWQRRWQNSSHTFRVKCFYSD
jgi:hypothetical protein